MTEMPYRKLGAAGVRVSALSLGGWTTFGGSVKDESVVRSIVTRAFEAGINYFDLADVYAKGEAERAMGAVLRDFPRHELVVASKVFWPMSDDINDRGLSRKHIIESVDRSLIRLGIDYLDLYFCHRFDDSVTLCETARAMDHLVRQGKVLYWGTSEWSGAQLSEVHAVCTRRNLYEPAVEQPQLSLLKSDVVLGDVSPAAKKLGMGLVTWSPLASGALTGKYDDGVPAGTRMSRIDWLREQILTPENLERVRGMKPIAERLGCTRAQLAIAWALGAPGVSSVITGATRVEQLEENLGSLDVTLDEETRSELETLFG
ncbi:MAG: aldo/keto reductase family protein [Planctomycetota bacterium]|jgi:voltage-dependent potassium channel beta subunit